MDHILREGFLGSPATAAPTPNEGTTLTALVPLATVVIVAAGLFLVTLGGAALVAPSRVSPFLLGFASSPRKHHLELALRSLVGAGFVLAAPSVRFPLVFRTFGWILLGTTAGLLIIPWHWHHRFAKRSVPEALRFLPLIGVSSLVLGALVLWAVFGANTV